MRKNLSLLIFFLLVGITACKPAAPVQSGSQNTPEALSKPSVEAGSQSQDSETYSLQELSLVPADDILLQLEYEPTFSPSRYQFAFGRIPEFTLYADGRVIYVSNDGEGGSLLETQLSPEETIRLIEENLRKGLDQLEDYTDDCFPQGDGTKLCIADASYSVLRQWMPDGQVKTIRNYANFSDQPEILEPILQRLVDFSHPSSRPYLPEKAVLFLQPAMGELGEIPGPFPLSGNYNPPPLGDSEMWAFILDGEQLEDYLRASSREFGLLIFDINGEPYQVELVPWLPGVDYQTDLEDAFPPSLASEVIGKNLFSSCPFAEDPGDHPDTFRFAFLEEGDLYLMKEEDGDHSQPVRLTGDGMVSSLEFSPDGARIYFADRDPAGPRVWAIDLKSFEAQPLTERFPAGRDLILQDLSPDSDWLPFSQLFDERSADLWAVRVDGSETQQIASLEQLRHADFPPDCSVMPNRIKWVPGSHRLIYDGLPYCDALFISMPSLRYYDLDTTDFGPYPSGDLVFSPKGNRVAIGTLEGLQVALAGGSEVKLLDVPFFPIGMGEWWLFPRVMWEKDDLSLLYATGTSIEADWENFDVSTNFVYRITLNDGTAQELWSFMGSPWSIHFSPDSQHIAYYTAPASSNFRTLHLARFEEGEVVDYAQGELLDFIGWSPGGRYFVYILRGESEDPHGWLGNTCGEPQAIKVDPIQNIHWLDASTYIIESRDDIQGKLRIYLAGIDREPEFLFGLDAENPQWDVDVIP